MLTKARAEYYRDINAHLRPRRRKLLHDKDPHCNKSLIPSVSTPSPTQRRPTASTSRWLPSTGESNRARRCTSRSFLLRTSVSSAALTARSLLMRLSSPSARITRTRRTEARKGNSSVALLPMSTACAPSRTSPHAGQSLECGGPSPARAGSADRSLPIPLPDNYYYSSI